MPARQGGAGPWGDGNDAYLEVIAGLFGWFHTNHPDLLDWVQRMRACDASFAHDFDAATPANLIALVYLLQDLERHPERWREHEPGRVPWPYRLRAERDLRQGEARWAHHPRGQAGSRAPLPVPGRAPPLRARRSLAAPAAPPRVAPSQRPP